MRLERREHTLLLLTVMLATEGVGAPEPFRKPYLLALPAGKSFRERDEQNEETAMRVARCLFDAGSALREWQGSAYIS